MPTPIKGRARLNNADIAEQKSDDKKAIGHTGKYVEVEIQTFGELSEDGSDYESYDANMVRPRFKAREKKPPNMEKEEVREVKAKKQRGIAELMQREEKLEHMDELQGKVVPKGTEKISPGNDTDKLENQSPGKKRRWETKTLAEADLGIPARTEVILIGRLRNKISGKIVVCESEEVDNAHLLAAKSVARNGDFVPKVDKPFPKTDTVRK
ncbi:hypothetical protein JTB14_021326 [Gonioctena quinquepunctata]|nr:hypothetical protein JTB14_021326 [Gonioctena quinquepunctata]